MRNVAPSTSRTTALGKYLAALSRSHSTKTDAPTAAEISRPSPQRTSLHILYILHDTLHESKHHSTSSVERSNLSAPLQPFIIEIFQSASSGQQARVRRRLDDLLLIWKNEHFYERDFLERLGDIIASANNATSATLQGTNNDDGIRDGAIGKGAKDVPFIMPATHGDPSTLCYDLPAGNLMPHIIPNSTVPIRPDAVRPLQFLAGPADEALVNAVKDFLHDVEKIDNPSMFREEDEGMAVDIDSLGQKVLRLETGEIDQQASDTYYGWSRAFCDKIKNRRNRGDEDTYRRRSRSSSSSRTPRKRRRCSYDSRGSRSEPDSRSRSRHRSRYSHGNRGRDRGSSSPSRSRSRSYSPPNYIPLERQENTQPRIPQQLPPPLPFSLPGNGQTIPPFPLGSDGLPIPPPRPPGYAGPWPPPPPPLPPSNPPAGFPIAPPGHSNSPHPRS